MCHKNHTAFALQNMKTTSSVGVSTSMTLSALNEGKRSLESVRSLSRLIALSSKGRYGGEAIKSQELLMSNVWQDSGSPSRQKFLASPCSPSLATTRSVMGVETCGPKSLHSQMLFLARNFSFFCLPFSYFLYCSGDENIFEWRQT